MSEIEQKSKAIGKTPDGQITEEVRIYRLALWVYVTVPPMAAMFFYSANISDSIVLLVYLAWYATSFAAQTFTLYALRQSIRNNTYAFPYGTGKLENFSSFFESTLILLPALYLIYDSFSRLSEPLPVGYGLAILPGVISGARQIIFYIIWRRALKQTRTPSPVLFQAVADFRIGVISSAGVTIAFVIGYGLNSAGLVEIGNRVDPLTGLLIALYMVYVGLTLILQNFRSLADLPLKEEDQLSILGILAAYFEHYDGVGRILSRASGKVKFVEIELVFSPNKAIGEVLNLAQAMENDLMSKLPGVRFKIIPVATSAESNTGVPLTAHTGSGLSR